MMKKTLTLALVAVAGSAMAGIYNAPINGGNAFVYGVGGLNVGFDTPAVAGGALGTDVRGFVIHGDWSLASGDPWSSETAAAVNMNGGSTVPRLIGGQNSTSAFTFGMLGGTYEQYTEWIGGDLFTGFGDLSTAGSHSIDFYNVVVGTARLSNASIDLYTDVFAPRTGRFVSSGNTWDRPSSLSSVRSGTYYYDATSFVAPASGSYMVGVDGRNGPNQFDSMLMLYEGSFDPMNPLTNLIGFSDDGGYDTASSSVFLNLTAGTNYVAVTTTFDEMDGGDFDLYIAGVPEPASMIALGAGLAAVAIRRRPAQP